MRLVLHLHINGKPPSTAGPVLTTDRSDLLLCRRYSSLCPGACPDLMHERRPPHHARASRQAVNEKLVLKQINVLLAF